MKERTRFQRFVQAAIFLAVVLIGVTSLGLTVHSGLLFTAGTGAAVAVTDNSDGTQTVQYSSTVTGGVSSVTGSGTVSCSPTTGAVVCTGSGGSAVSSVTGAGATSCSPTTGAVVCTTPSVTLTSGSGISVTGGPGYVVNLAVPVAPANGGTGAVSPTAHNVPIAEGASAFNLAAPSTAGGLLASNGSSSDPSFSTLAGDVTCGTPSGSSIPCTVGRVRGITVSAQTQLVGRAIINTDGVTPPTLTTWAFATPATVTQNTVTQFTSSSVTWSTVLASGVLSVVSTPVSLSAPVFEITGFQTGDNVVLRLDTTDSSFGSGGHQDETLILTYCFSSGTCTFPTGFVTQAQESNLSALSLSDNYQVTAHGFVASATSGSNLFIEPVVGNVHTSASTQFTVLGGNTTLTVEAWR